MIAAPLAALAASPPLEFAVSWLAVAGWVAGTVFAVAVVGIVVALLTDDRDPTTVIAWLLVITLLPLLGVVLYFFIGRNYRRDTPARRRVRGEIDVEAAMSVMPQVTQTCSEFTAGTMAALADTSAAKLAVMGARAEGTPVLPADERRALHPRRGHVPPPARRPERRAALHPPDVPHLGAGRAHGEGDGDPARTPGAGCRGAHPVRLGARACATARTSSNGWPPPGPR